MTQTELDAAVATATGESVSEIQRLGFGIADPVEFDFDPEPIELDRYLNWDFVEATRMRPIPL